MSASIPEGVHLSIDGNFLSSFLFLAFFSSSLYLLWDALFLVLLEFYHVMVTELCGILRVMLIISVSVSEWISGSWSTEIDSCGSTPDILRKPAHSYKQYVSRTVDSGKRRFNTLLLIHELKRSNKSTGYRQYPWQQ